MKLLRNWVVCLVGLCFSFSISGCKTETKFIFPTDGIKIAETLSAFRVSYCLKVLNDHAYIAYYDTAHAICMADLNLQTGTCSYKALPSKVKWDSHNYITFDFDKEGYLHLSGNMHTSPLVYYRSTQPYDIQSLEKIDYMTGENEDRTTYPQFMKNGADELIYHYRIGGSGNGSEIYNIYDLKSKTWRRFLDQCLVDGEGLRNAYMTQPVLGKDGYYHMVWVWRDTADCSTNHTLSYARSKDLLHWESISGEPTELPITYEKEMFYVDPTPPKGGLFNPAVKLGFNSKGAPVISYMKYDEQGNNQLYIAKYENNAWRLQQMTNWKDRWLFEGIGTMKILIDIKAPRVLDDGKMVCGFRHFVEGQQELVFDEETLQVIGTRSTRAPYPARFYEVTSSFPGMQVNFAQSAGYLLRWESLPSNRDRKPEGKLPEPSQLMLYKIK